MTDPFDGTRNAGTPNAGTPPVPPVTPTPPAQQPVAPPEFPVASPQLPQPPVAPPVAPPVTAPSFAYPAASGYGAPDGAVAAPSKKTLSLIGMIAGIVGIVGAPVAVFPIIGSVLGLFIPVAAVVLGFLGKSREGAAAKGLWLTAIITGLVGILIMVIGLIAWIAIIASGEFQNQLDQVPTY